MRLTNVHQHHNGLRSFRTSGACLLLVAGLAASGAPAAAQGVTPPAAAASNGSAVVPAPVPADYVIGPEDVLVVSVWREPDLSGEVVVRPDGKITLPVLNEIAVAGMTPEQLRGVITEHARQYVTDPNVSVVVKAINSRKVFISGNVERPGPYSLNSPTTVVQLIAMAGGLREYADSDKIVIVRTDEGKSMTLPFNFSDIIKRKNLQQNIELRPGDTVLVP